MRGLQILIFTDIYPKDYVIPIDKSLNVYVHNNLAFIFVDNKITCFYSRPQ